MKNLFKGLLNIIICGVLCFIASINTSYADEAKLKFAVISDHKSNFEGLEKALEFIAAQNVDFLIVAGDFSPLSEAYPNYYHMYGFEVGDNLDPDGQDIYFSLGNHDSEPSGDSFFQNNIAPYYPENGPSLSPKGTIFSFDRGNCHFVITNQYWNYPNGGYTPEQLNWIAQDLSESQQPFKFLIGHEPAFPIDRHVGDSLDIDPSMRDSFWEILAQNGAQAYFCGHSHHLSVIMHNGVYQFDAGEVNSDHLCITLVEVDSSITAVSLYETNGFIPASNNDNNVFSASLTETNNDDLAYKVLFSSDIREENKTWGCFIDAASY